MQPNKPANNPTDRVEPDFIPGLKQNFVLGLAIILGAGCVYQLCSRLIFHSTMVADPGA
jgi:hypothetical protein